MNAPQDLATLARPPWRSRGFVAGLGGRFAVAVAAQPVPAPQWAARSMSLAETLGLADWLGTDGALHALAGHGLDDPAEVPLATVYSGHQFGVWAGQLGDGRALLLGEVDTPAGAQELQLKGSGLTPYSRMGDGRAVLRSSIREYLCSEAMHALGIPTTRALAVVASPLPVRREEIETAAVVTRVAPSFLRFGHFEHFAHTDTDVAALRRLVEAVVARYFPELAGAAVPATALLHEVTLRTARLLAQWQAVGFCHGVMNTDNMSILGLTIDYGPFGFLDGFDPGHVCNHSDHQGRYAYARQPNVAFWNLHALAQALLPLIGEPDDALAALEAYRTEYPGAMLAQWRAKLGLVDACEGDRELVDDLLQAMADARADFTITFRRLAGFSTADGAANADVRDLFLDRAAFDAWAARYTARLHEEGSIDAARRARAGDFTELQRLASVLERPFDEQPEHEAYAAFPPDWAGSIEVSCSS